MLKWEVGISDFFAWIWNYYEFLKENNENSYQISNKLKISNNFTIGVYYGVKIQSEN